MRGNNYSHSQAAKKVKGISIRIVIVSVIFVAILLALLFITNHFVVKGETDFDSQVINFLRNRRTAATTRIMNFFTFFGSTKFLFPAYILIVLFYIFYVRNLKRSFNIAAIGLSSIGLLLLVKNIFQRHRPPNPLIAAAKGYSYPSGHSSSAFTFCGILIYILWQSALSKLWKWAGTIFLFLFAALIAFSRVYLNVHYASDVVAGFCLAFLWLTICIGVLRRFNRSDQNVKPGRN